MTWMGFNLVDAAVLAFLLGGVAGGVRRGLSGELARVLIAAGAIAIIYYFARPVAQWMLSRYDLSQNVALLLASAALLLISYIGLTLVRLALAAVFNFGFKGRAEKLGGALFGLLRSALVAVLLLTLFALLPNDTLHRHVAIESRFGRWVHTVMHPLVDRVSEHLPDFPIPGKQETDAADAPVEWMDDAMHDWGPAPLGPVQ